MGDSVDNIKGVPGIGEKGARELIADARHARRAARGRAGRFTQKRYREGLLAHADDARLSPRAGADSHRRAGRRSMPARCASRGRRANGCYALFSSLGFRTLVGGVRARRRRRALRDGTHVARSLGGRGRARAGSSERRRASASPRSPPDIVGRARRRRRLGVQRRRRARRRTSRWRTRASRTRPTCRRAMSSRGSARCWPIRRSPRSDTT